MVTPATAQFHKELAQQDTSLTFREIVDASERYFEKVGKRRGIGYKQYERWKYWAERNLDENGRVRTKRAALDDYAKFLGTPLQNIVKSTGAYSELGPLSAVNTSTWSSGLGRVGAIGLDPNDDSHIIVGAPTGGIWKTTNLGVDWVPLFDNQALIDVYALEISHANADHYWAGLSGGMVRSTDGGATWVPVNGPGNNALYNTITMHPANDNTIMLAVTPAAPQNLYALEETGGGFKALYLSTNEGASWTTLSDNACNCNNIMGYDQNAGGGQAPRDMDLIVSPVDPNILHVAGVETWRSVNQGQNWVRTTVWSNPNGFNFIHADIDLLIYDGARIVAGTDGGIYYSTNEGDNWTSITDGLGVRQFYRIGGSQDNGTGILRNGTWYDWLGADGMETFIDHNNADIVYGTSQNGNLYKSVDGGNSRTGISTPGVSGNWVTPFEPAPGQSDVIYTARTEVGHRM